MYNTIQTFYKMVILLESVYYPCIDSGMMSCFPCLKTSMVTICVYKYAHTTWRIKDLNNGLIPESAYFSSVLFQFIQTYIIVLTNKHTLVRL